MVFNSVIKYLLPLCLSFQLGFSGTCEDIQELMDNTVREDCTAGFKSRGGQICVPREAGPLLIFIRQLSSQPMAMRSFAEAKDEQVMVGFYPKWEKCFLIRRTICPIKGSTIDPVSQRIYWIEICPAENHDADVNVPSLHSINLDGSGHVHNDFQVPLENWFNVNLEVDHKSKKLYVVTYKDTLECSLSGVNCSAYEQPSEGKLLTSQID